MESQFLISERDVLSSDEETEFRPQIHDDNKRTKPFTPLIEPKDRCYFVYIAFSLFGLVTVFPWNFFITADGYWKYKFRNTNMSLIEDPEYKSDLQKLFGSYLSISSMGPAAIFLFINTLISSKVSHKVRLVTAQFGMLIFFSMTVVFTKIDTDSWQVTFFAITIAIAVLICSCAAIYSGAVMGMACSFPSSYLQAMMNGQALGGVFASVANIIAIALGLSPNNTSFVYFLIALVTIFLSLVAYLSARRTLYFKYYVQQARDAEARAEVDSLIRGQSRNTICFVFRRIFLQGLSCFIVFAGTLSVFPALTDLAVSVNVQDGSQITNQYFIPVGAFLLFNIGDLTGRVVGGALRMPTQKHSFFTFILTVLRLGLVPLIMLCNVHPRQNLPIVLNSDVAFVLLVLALGLTNGYFVNLAFLYAPLQVEIEYRDIAGAMMAFFMGIGLLTGALLSNVLVRLL